MATAEDMGEDTVTAGKKFEPVWRNSNYFGFNRFKFWIVIFKGTAMAEEGAATVAEGNFYNTARLNT